MAYLDDVLYNDRVRRVNKTIAFSPSTTDQITVVGPTNRIIITCHGSNTGGTALEPSGGLPNAFQRILVNTNKRGTIWDMSGIEAELISTTFYNAERKSELAAAATAESGVNWVLPLSLDAGEMATITITFGAIADIGGTISAWAGAVVRATVVIRQPKTYWAFRSQVMGVAGAIAATNSYTQPQIPIIPGFALCGEGTNIACTGVTTIVTNLLFPQRWTWLVTHGDDYLIDADCKALRALMTARASAGGYLETGVAQTMYGIPWHMLVARHTPVANNDSTQFTITAGATGSFADSTLSRVCYFYVTGLITDDVSIPPPATRTVGGEVALANPARVLSPSQAIGPAVIPAGTQGGSSLFNLRGNRAGP